MSGQTGKRIERRAPPSWIKLRERGEAFLREIPDDAFAATVLEGAFQVGESKNQIRGNLCAAAIREVTSHVLHALAPDSRVSNCCWYKQEPNTKGPTRQQCVIYIVQAVYRSIL